MTESIASYGVLGDTRSAALVSAGGSIDWLCVPRFDGQPVFGALIDPDHGGRWSLAPRNARVTERSYADGAASIHATWEGPHGAVTVADGLISDASSHLMPRMTLVRHVRCIAGRAQIDVVFDPRLGLPGRKPGNTRHGAATLVCLWPSIALSISCDRGLRMRPGETATLQLMAGETVTFVLGLAYREPLVFLPPSQGEDLLVDDDRWWRSWLRRFDYHGPHEAMIRRSLLTLRLLTYAPSGAPVAAPTTSLPAPEGSDQAWDYRFAWPRDASIGTGAFLSFGGRDEPQAFLEWFINASRITRPRLDVLYNLDGRPLAKENLIHGVSGFGSQAPVRIGNAASLQTQLDVYGWVLESAWRMHSAGESLQRTHWRALRAFAAYIARHWAEPDNGLWEERGPLQHYVHSKLMAWVGLDRALRLAESYPAKGADRIWRHEREALATQIRSRGFSPRLRAYRRIFDRDELDAAMLMLAPLGFDEDRDRVNATIDAIWRGLGAGGAMLYRYVRSGKVSEGAFLPCSFWLVHALAHVHRLDEAEIAFDELCSLATPLGLYAEQVDPATRQPLGNFPQAFSHATFLEAAAALNAARETSQGSSRRPRVRSTRRPVSARRS